MGEKTKKGLEELFFQEKPWKILVYLKKEEKPLYTAIIAKGVDGTYAHTLNVLSELEKLKLVSFRESGRIKIVNLTELGAEVAQILINLIDLLRLADIEKGINQVYKNEIKGKLREQMNKKTIFKQLEKLKRQITEYLEQKPANVSVFAKKVLKRIDEVIAEAFGYPPG